MTIAGITLVNPPSMVNFAWYFCLWNAFILFRHRESLSDFTVAFLVNSAWLALFVVVQSAVYPDTFGTTSPLSTSWTDDSYFYSLVADSVRPELLTRPFYWEYEHTFATLIRALTPLRIEHPLDVLFFQSGTAALLAAFSAKFTFQLSSDERLAKVVFVFTMICPFLMMNGGVIFLRDTLTAALLVYSLCMINERRFLNAGTALVLQIALRPGTGAILTFAYPIIYFSEVRNFVRRHPIVCVLLVAVLVFLGVLATPFAMEYATTHFNIETIGFLGREIFADLEADPSANNLFLSIQQLPFVIKLPLNAAYIFMYPFLTLRTVIGAAHFDLRDITLSLLVPLYSLWLNAWFFAGALSSKSTIDRHREILIAIVVILVLVGVYSLQTRHKTIIYPLYYVMVAIGFAKAAPFARRCGYVISSILLLIQVASVLR